MHFSIYCTTRVNVISTRCQHAEGLVRALIDSPNWVGLQLCYVHPSIPFKRPLFSVDLCVRDALWSHWLPIVCRGAPLSCSFVMTVGQPLYRLNKITQLFIWGPNPSTLQHPPSTPKPASREALKTPQNYRSQSESEHISAAQESRPVVLNRFWWREQDFTSRTDRVPNITHI